MVLLAARQHRIYQIHLIETHKLARHHKAWTMRISGPSFLKQIVHRFGGIEHQYGRSQSFQIDNVSYCDK